MSTFRDFVKRQRKDRLAHVKMTHLLKAYRAATDAKHRKGFVRDKALIVLLDMGFEVGIVRHVLCVAGLSLEPPKRVRADGHGGLHCVADPESPPEPV